MAQETSIFCGADAFHVRRGRWHTTGRIRGGETVMRLSVASHYTWENGYCYGSVHVGTRNQYASIPDGFHWWSQGEALPGSFWLKPGTPRDLADIWPVVQHGLIRATVRDIREPMPPFMRHGLHSGDPEARKRRLWYNRDALSRCVAKYGATSEQARLLSKLPVVDRVVDTEDEPPGVGQPAGQDLSEADKAVRRMWAPSWTQIMTLPRSDR